MSAEYRVLFTVSAEVVVTLAATDEDDAADRAWEFAQEHLQTIAVPDSRGVAVRADLDGIGADEITEVTR